MEHDSFYTATGRHLTTRHTPETWTLTIHLGERYQTTTRTGRTTETELAWLNANRGQHWGESSPQVRAWRKAAAIHAEASGIPTGLGYCTVHGYIHKPRTTRYDPNNLAPTAKAIVDGLVQDHGLLPDDDWRHLDGPHLHHGSIQRGATPSIEIRITETELENPHA